MPGQYMQRDTRQAESRGTVYRDHIYIVPFRFQYFKDLFDMSILS
jgi:hypothetical protein